MIVQMNTCVSRFQALISDLNTKPLQVSFKKGGDLFEMEKSLFNNNNNSKYI